MYTYQIFTQVVKYHEYRKHILDSYESYIDLILILIPKMIKNICDP